jgi:hypothetical protein
VNAKQSSSRVQGIAWSFGMFIAWLFIVALAIPILTGSLLAMGATWVLATPVNPVMLAIAAALLTAAAAGFGNAPRTVWIGVALAAAAIAPLSLKGDQPLPSSGGDLRLLVLVALVLPVVATVFGALTGSRWGSRRRRTSAST